MVRELGIVAALSAVMAGAAAGQSVRATAVILAPVEATRVEVEVQSAGGQWSVRQHEAPVEPGDTRLLRRTFIGAEAVDVGRVEAVRVRENGTLRLERRRVDVEGVPVGELRSGVGLLIDAMEEFTITRVIAANS